MGRAICELFAAEGARVVVNYASSQEAAESVAELIRRRGGEAVAVRTDVSVDAQVRDMVRETAERWGRLDILVNNAGWTRRTPHHLLEDLTDEIWDRTLNVNLRGVFYCTRAAAPLLKKNPGASVINIASVAPYTGSGSSIVYAAAKAGVISMTKSLARVLAPEVRVNALVPGTVRTGFGNWPAEMFENAIEQSALKRIPTVEEVALTALYLAADATAMTGDTIRVDCGAVALRKA